MQLINKMIEMIDTRINRAYSVKITLNASFEQFERTCSINEAKSILSYIA